MRVKAVTYKHFIGCASTDEVKKKYKTLAISLHPDKNGGKREAFQEMYAEYEYITKGGGDVYPIRSYSSAYTDNNAKASSSANGFGGAGFNMNFDEWFRQYTQQEEKAKAKQYAEAEAARKARDAFNKAYEYEKRQKRPKTDEEVQKEFAQKHEFATQLIREIIEEGIYKNTSANSMLMDLFKIDNMGLNHFLYARWYFGTKGGRLSVEWAQTAYKNYVSVQQIKWDL